MNEPLYSPHLFENNPHYESILRILRDEAESIIQGCENRELLTKNAEDLSMDEEEYKAFLLDFYFSTGNERRVLMEKFIRSISV